MSGFHASYLEIDDLELVQHLLNATGQKKRDHINPQDLLDFLKLQFIKVDFGREFAGSHAAILHARPRALISFPDRLIAADQSLDATRLRFSVLHEVGHYVLPSHQRSLYICDDRAMSFQTQFTFEKEANRFAADLLFLADRFDLEANSLPISPHTVKKLAQQFGASCEATARRMVERTCRDCMFVAFKEDSVNAVDNKDSKKWAIRYCIASPTFAHKYFPGLTRGVIPSGIAERVCRLGDIARSVKDEVTVSLPGRGQQVFQGEYFYNSFNIFCFLTPKSTG